MLAAEILASLKRDELLKVADALDVELTQRRQKTKIVTELLRHRDLQAVLMQLSMASLRLISDEKGLDRSGRTKVVIAKRVAESFAYKSPTATAGAVIECLTVGHYKSFESAELPLSEMTLLIGANASGKSNLLEVVALLSWMARGGRLSQFESAVESGQLPLRGRSTDLVWSQGEPGDIELGCRLAADENHGRLTLALSLRVDSLRPRIVHETLTAPDDDSKFPLYTVVEAATEYSHALQVEYNNFSRGRNKPRIACIDEEPVFSQLTTPARFGERHAESQIRLPSEAARIQSALSAILFLDPSPRRMRGYSYQADHRQLKGDGSNLSAVLYDLTELRGQKQEVLSFIHSLPEQRITDISYLETPRSEVMLTLTETFGETQRACEAALLSDGTLRVLAVCAALLSVAEETLVVIEEIDNGVHPSRARELLGRIREVARRRRLRVLLTTHNPALLDAIPDEVIPSVVACYRDPQSGRSRITRLSDIESFPALVASGPLGRAATTGELDRHLKSRPSLEERRKGALLWLDELMSVGES